MADYKELLNAYQRFITAKIIDKAFGCIVAMYKLNKSEAYKVLCAFRNYITLEIQNNINPIKNNALLRNAYALSARDKFDDYCIFMEWEREAQKRFYLPRRKQLLPIVKSLQDMEDDVLDLLAVSMPPGTGKTTLAIFFLTWVGGRHPELPLLGGSHSNSFLASVYAECLRMIDVGGEYNWNEVFPDVPLVRTNAKDMRIDLGSAKRFETFEFSSVGSGNAGKVRAGSYLYCDDLIADIEEALSKERLDKKWNQYTTDLRQRKIGKCKELHIATRWSVHDVIGRLAVSYEGNPRARFLVFSALDENDESNFDYPYGLGFTTEFYHEQRNIMDGVSWRALYMNEPIEREGLLFNREQLRTYFELPNTPPDAIIAVCDTKDKGKDYCVMPVAYKYGEDCYIEDILCDNSSPEIVEPRLIALLILHKVKMARFESNSAGGKVAEKVQKGVREQHGITHITTKFSTDNKETRIIVDSPYVIRRFLFKDKSVASPEYNKAMGFLCSYTMLGKNNFDDVPDAFSMLADFDQSLTGNVVIIQKRPF